MVAILTVIDYYTSNTIKSGLIVLEREFYVSADFKGMANMKPPKRQALKIE
jgi:hypothetical protein